MCCSKEVGSSPCAAPWAPHWKGIVELCIQAMVSKGPLCPNWVVQLAKTWEQIVLVRPLFGWELMGRCWVWHVPEWCTRGPYYSLGRSSRLWIIKIFRLQMWRKLGVRSYLEMSLFCRYCHNLWMPVSACIFTMEGRFAKLGELWSLQHLPEL